MRHEHAPDFIIRPTEQTRNHAQFERCETRNARKTRHTRASTPSGRQRCATPSRTPCGASATTASSLTVAGPAWSRSSCCLCLCGVHFCDGKEFLSGQDHPGSENTHKHLCFGANVAVRRRTSWSFLLELWRVTHSMCLVLSFVLLHFLFL